MCQPGCVSTVAVKVPDRSALDINNSRKLNWKFSSQITMRMEAAKSVYWKSYGGQAGLDFLLTTLKKDFADLGLGAYFNTIFIDNPARLYSFSDK
jgi:hypothetical protein